MTTLTIILFLIMDPIGQAGAFVDTLEKVPQSRRTRILLREMGIALGIILFFNFLGEIIFSSILGVSENAVRIAGGIIIFIIALRRLFPSSDLMEERIPDDEPFLIPLAVPRIAGPSLLATVMLYAHMEPSMMKMFMAIMCAWTLGVICLLAGPLMLRVFRRPGLAAFEQLTGIILILLAVQRLMEGIKALI